MDDRRGTWLDRFLVRIDEAVTTVWVRLPGNTVVKLSRQTRGNLLVGRVGTLELTLDLSEN